MSNPTIAQTPAVGPVRATEHRRTQSDGSLYVRELVMPPSDLWSAEFSHFYAASMEATGNLRIPRRAAPRSEWDEFDARFDRQCNDAPLAAALQLHSVDVEETTIAGVRAAVVTPRHGIGEGNERRVLINLHGGGFVVNRGLKCGQLESVPVAASGRLKVITLDYRQAPFHRYPAASEDVQTVYTELLKQYEPTSIGIYGCSAGGILAAQAIARFQRVGLPRPGAAGIFCMAPPPPFSLTPPWGPGWGDSRMWYFGVPRNQPSEVERDNAQSGEWYMESADPNDPEAYPGAFISVLEKFPPTLFLSGTRDFALSTVITTHARFVKLGIDASLYLMEGCPHAAHVYAVGTPEAEAANAYVARWFIEHLDR